MVPSGKSDYELISELAFRIYEQEGCPEGQADDHWSRAERALQQLRLSDLPRRRPKENGRATGPQGKPIGEWGFSSPG